MDEFGEGWWSLALLFVITDRFLASLLSVDCLWLKLLLCWFGACLVVAVSCCWRPWWFTLFWLLLLLSWLEVGGKGLESMPMLEQI